MIVFLKIGVIKIFNIYKITNSLNGKIYVGMTKQTIEKRFMQHSTANTPLGNAMRDCGLDNFTVEVIETCPSLESAHDREKFWIKVLKSKIPYGYNQSDGGEGGYSNIQKDSTKFAIKMTVAESLRRYRKEFNKTQKDLANVLGVSPQAYQVYEVKVKPPAEVIAKLATELNISADYLLGLTDTPRPLNFADSDNELIFNAIKILDEVFKRREQEINSAEE